MACKHLALRLSQYAPVLFVDPAVSAFRALRTPQLRGTLRASRLTQVAPRIARLTPLAPPGISRPGLREAAQIATRLAIVRATRALGGDVHAVVVGSFERLFGASGERLRVLYGTDDFAAGGALMKLPTAWLHRQEAAQLARADRIVAVSQPLADRWQDMGYPVTLIPNGCDAPRYASTDDAPLPDDVDLPRPIAGVIGHLCDRIDMDYLDAVADTGHSLLLIGPRDATFQPARMDALIRRPNVQWVGPKPFEALPSYLRIMKVGLTPYADSEFNRGSFPLKTLEYLAAGRATVSSDLPATRWLDTDLITVCTSSTDFARRTAEQLAANDDEHVKASRMAFASKHSWDARAADFAVVLGLAPSSALSC
jgi:teichuronic acid biosynthesis glycosyltransferase TuaH